MWIPFPPVAVYGVNWGLHAKSPTVSIWVVHWQCVCGRRTVLFVYIAIYIVYV